MLDNIKFMRNWASAAHPNQIELTGLQLISWLETCIKEVISLPLSNITIEIRKLLYNIKNNEITVFSRIRPLCRPGAIISLPVAGGAATWAFL